jgi:hypothetical protein
MRLKALLTVQDDNGCMSVDRIPIWRIALMWVVFLLFLLSMGADGFLDRHVLRHPAATVTYAPSTVVRCGQTLRALAIAAEALPHLNREHSFGLDEAVAGLRSWSCFDTEASTGRRLQGDPDDIEAYKATFASRIDSLPANPDAPAVLRWLGLAPPSIDPVFTLERLRDLAGNWTRLNTGQGLMHYIRCDYSLKRAPNVHFLMADIYEAAVDGRPPSAIDARIAARVAECGLDAWFQAAIASALAQSDLLPVVFR